MSDSRTDFSDMPESTDEELRRARRVSRPVGQLLERAARNKAA
jgi:hypothetical protein